MYKTNLTGVFLIVVLLMSIATFYLPCSEAENGKNKSTVDSWEPTPLSDPAEAYIAPDFYTRQKAQPTGDNLIPRNPPHAEYAKNERQQIKIELHQLPS